MIHYFLLILRSIVLIVAVLLPWTTASSSLTIINPNVARGAELYKQGKVEEAVSVLTLSAYQGSAAAQYDLSVIYYRRDDSELNQKEFRFWLQKAAESNDVDAQFNLGMLYYRDENVLGRYEKAVKWLSRAASSEHAKAQYNLGYLSFSNLAIDVSHEKGVLWLQRAVNLSDQKAIQLMKKLLQGDLSNPPALYELSLEMKTEHIGRKYVVGNEDAKVFAIPAGRQEPLLIADKGSIIDVLEINEGWLRIRLEQGFPAWVPESQIKVERGLASSIEQEASLYVSNKPLQQAFKIGLIDDSVQLAVIGYEPGWVKVTAPNYFTVWIREADVIEQVELVPSNATKIVSTKIQNNSSSAENEETVLAQKMLINWHPVYVDSSDSSIPLGLLSKGKVVTIEEESGDFSRVSWEGGVEAWIFAKFLEVSGEVGTVTEDKVRVRILPNTGNSATIVARLQRNQKFKVVGSQDDWHRIVVSFEQQGWLKNL